MKLYVVRHGQTQWNKEKRMQGWGNSNLTSKGTSQAKLLGEALKDINFTKVYSSPLGRAVDTTNNIIGNRSIEIKVNKHFKEMGFGIWEGKTPEYIKSHYKEQYTNIWNYADKYIPAKDGEKFQDVSNRVKQGINELINSNYKKDDNILLVTHGMIIQMLILHTKKLPLDKLWERPVVNSSSLTIIEINQNGQMNVVIEDNIDHLD